MDPGPSRWSFDPSHQYTSGVDAGPSTSGPSTSYVPTSYSMDPGPLDRSILHMQQQHRSSIVWDEPHGHHIRARRRDASLHRQMPIHSMLIEHLQQSGFYGVARVGFITLDWQLITALVERWRPETHTFHLPHGECTITLQDVAIQLGLPVDGLPVTGYTRHDWGALCEELLGFRPTQQQMKGGKLKMNVLAERVIRPGPTDDELIQHDPDDPNDDFYPLPEFDEVAVNRYARSYILQLIGGSLFSDKSNNLVHLMFLPLLADFRTTGKYSWGSACLAWLYRELCHAAHGDPHEISGPLILLQLWAWDRFPHIAPIRRMQFEFNDIVSIDQVILPEGPLGMRWKDAFAVTEVSTHVLPSYREAFDIQLPEQIIWEPYEVDDVLSIMPLSYRRDHMVWRSRVPLICFHIVEWYFPDRVLRQFGMRQLIPDECDTERSLHEITLRASASTNWATYHQRYIQIWDRRHELVVSSPRIDNPADFYEAEYMRWYRQITRRCISRRGALFDYLIPILDKDMFFTCFHKFLSTS